MTPVPAFLLLALLLVPLGACRRAARPEVVVYTSVDQPHAEPILKAFEARTGIRVQAVYDLEAVKTVGLANRLLEERARPRADVFWNGEILQTLRLARDGALEPYRPGTAQDLPADRRPGHGLWTAIGGRARVFLVDTRQLDPAAAPRTLAAFAEASGAARRRGLALPLFGTTLTHAATLSATWGPTRTQAWFEALRTAGVRFLEGNASVRDAVVRGELAVGLTDTDDAEGALAKGAPVAVVEPEGDSALVIPSSVALVKGGPHPPEGRRLVDFLASREAEVLLTANGFWQVAPRHSAASRSLPKGATAGLRVPWERVLEELPRTSRDLRERFTR